MAITASFSPNAKLLLVSSDNVDDVITISCNAIGQILVNGGAVTVLGGQALLGINSGASASATQIGPAASEIISNGGVTVGDTIGVGAVQDVLAGASAIDTVVSANSHEFVASGGVVSGSDLLGFGAGLSVSSGGSALVTISRFKGSFSRI